MLTFGAASSLAAGRTCPAAAEGSLDCLSARVDNSWIDQLEPDPERVEYRAVDVGHAAVPGLDPI